MKKKEGAGGKLNRGEIVQTRLNAKLRFAAEIMARLERRTVSSFIEQLIEQASKTYFIKDEESNSWAMKLNYLDNDESSTKKKLTIDRIIKALWTLHEPTRFVVFAKSCPDLLNEAEESLIKTIEETKYFWTYYLIEANNSDKKIKEWKRMNILEGLVTENLAEYWNRLKDGKIDAKDLSKLPMGDTLKQDTHPIINDDNTRLIYENPKPLKSEPLETEEITSQSDQFWLKHTQTIDTVEKIELKRTKDGTKLVKTFALPTREALTKILKNNNAAKKEKTHHGNKVRKTDSK